jgi:hypothetical protein
MSNNKITYVSSRWIKIFSSMEKTHVDFLSNSKHIFIGGRTYINIRGR